MKRLGQTTMISTRVETRPPRITGFLHEAGDLYRRFDETAFNTVFDLAWVKATLLNTGWTHVYFASTQDLTTPVAEPESEGRVFVIARK